MLYNFETGVIEYIAIESVEVFGVSNETFKYTRCPTTIPPPLIITIEQRRVFKRTLAQRAKIIQNNVLYNIFGSFYPNRKIVVVGGKPRL